MGSVWRNQGINRLVRRWRENIDKIEGVVLRQSFSYLTCLIIIKDYIVNKGDDNHSIISHACSYHKST